MSSSPSIPISRNKIRVPFRRRELITRARLIDALYNQLEKRILLVVAPAGYGKTSLLVDLAHQTEIPVCWLSLDPLDGEPQRFLGYLIASISERFPQFGRDSRAALESMTSAERDEERLLVTITNEINARIDEHFLLILDDFHLISDEPFAGHVIRRLLSLTDEKVHLILTSRSLPNLPDSPLLVARNQVGGLTFEELSFLPEEIQALFQQNNSITLSQADAAALVEQTEGWIAAIHLSNGQPSSLPKMHPLESTRELFDFFSREVLSRQSGQVRRFLLMTSCFDTFDVALCRRVLAPLLERETLDWSMLFELVRVNNIFSVPVDDMGRWMRYHHLFRHFLRSQLQYEEPVLAWHIQHQLARVYEEDGSWEEALEVYAHLNDYNNQVRVLKRVGSVFIMSGRILSLANWLEKLPDEVLHAQPVLVSLLGIIHASRGENHKALELYNLAERSLGDDVEKADWTANLVRRAEVYRQMGRFDQAIQDVERILELTEHSANPEMQITFVEAQRIRGLAAYGLGHMKEALVWLQNALETCRVQGIRKSIPILETELGVVHRRLGEPEVTERYYASALKAWENMGNTGWKARLLNNMGLLFHMTGRLEEAYAFLDQALQTAQRSGYVQIETNILISLGDLLTDLNDLESAYTQYDKALTLATHLGHSLYIYYASLGEARLQRLGGEPLLAVEELNHAALSQVKMGIFEQALFNLELGICLLEAGKLEPALVVLRDAVSLFEEGGNQMEREVARLWLATALFIHFPESAMQQLREIMPPAREWQKPTPLMLQAGRSAQWLRKRGSTQLFKDPVLGKFLEQAEQVRASMPALASRIGVETQASSPDTVLLDIISFGEVQVQRNQRTVGTSEWQTREARDLFFFMLQAPPMTKEQIALEFWPDISPARLKMRFKSNIYRIRQALGQNVILYENDKYRFNREIRHHWDRQELDTLLQSGRPEQDEARIDFLNQALLLMKGPYMADLDAEWAVSDRLKFQDIRQELLVELAGLYLKTGQARKCLGAASAALDFDPLLEAAHRLAIQAYASLHDLVGMTLQYRRYQQLLMTELGLQPSSEMNALYAQLLDAF
jgi:LuxR family transcriptional regulator, maltose regulon positive regulatory protein